MFQNVSWLWIHYIVDLDVISFWLKSQETCHFSYFSYINMLRTYHFSFTTLRTLQLKYFTMPESLCFISYSEKTPRKQERISCKNIVKTVNSILLNGLENSPSSMHSLHKEEMALEIVFSLFFFLSPKNTI